MSEKLYRFCGVCDGSGWVPDPDDIYGELTIECAACDGVGLLPAEDAERYARL